MGTSESQLFNRAACGDKAAADELFATLYNDLKQVAAVQIWAKKRNPTFGPTAAVHALYEKWMRSGRISSRNRAEFFAAAAVAIQRIVVDYYRWKQVRSRNRHAVDVNEFSIARSDGKSNEVDAEVIKNAMDELKLENERQYRAAMLRYYDELQIQEIADLLGLSTQQVRRDIRAAEAFIKAYLLRHA